VSIRVHPWFPFFECDSAALGESVVILVRAATRLTVKTAMQTAAKIIAPLALLATLLPPVLHLFHVLGAEAMKGTMLVAAIAWFATAPFWMKGGSE